MTGFAELAVTTNFSFLRGASHPGELVARAKELGLAGIGIADRNSLAGVVRAYGFARDNAIAPDVLKVVTGARLVFADGTPDMIVYPQDRAAYGRLSRLLGTGNLRAEKGRCILAFDDLIAWSDGFRMIVMGAVPRATEGEIGKKLARLHAMAPGRLWVGASMAYGRGMRQNLAARAALARSLGAPLVATNDVLMHVAERRPLADILTCIREGATIDDAGLKLAANAERHLKSGAEMARLFAEAPGAVAETMRVLSGITFSLGELSHDYPEETRAGFATPQAALEAFTWAGADGRYPAGVPDKVADGIRHELALIAELDYARYFLTVYDIVQFARREKILCQGRGSAANSSVCFCLGITQVDPAAQDLLFERFLSAERREPPDIDVDFEHEKRERVIQHIYSHYGRERAGLAATVISYRGRSAIREVGRAFGLSEDMVSALSGTMWGWGPASVETKEARRIGLDPDEPRLARVIRFAEDLNGFPRHLSQHTGGFVITRSRLDEVVPILNAAMDQRTTIEWDKDDLDTLGLLKIDVLGLGMLTCLSKGFGFLKDYYGRDLTLSTLPSEEKAVYSMISRADTIGVFQIESRAQMSMLPRLRPEKFYDLVIEVAIVRPGPIQGDMVHPYLRRRQGLEDVRYESPALETVLKRTLGVPLFQEQAMKIAIVAGGFKPAESDQLRRAMATFRKVGTIGTFGVKLIEGMVANGYTREFAERCFKQIEGFGEYGFPESHAISFALLVYASAWMKCFYPDVFAAALLNAQPMGFYSASQIVRDAREHGVEIREVDINFSFWDNSLEAHDDVARKTALHPRHAAMADDIRARHAVRLGFRQIDGLGEADMTTLAGRRGRGYDSVRDLWLRGGLAPGVLERLARADAFRSLGLDRREALWAVRGLNRVGDADDLPLFAANPARGREPDAHLPAMPLGEHVVEDYRHISLSLKAHPVSFVRADLLARRMVRSQDLPALPSGRLVRIAGLVLVRQRPGTAKGVIFMTIEDETGAANIIVWPKIFERLRPIVLGARFVAVAGRLQSHGGVVHVIAGEMEDLTPMLARLAEGGPKLSSLARADEVKRPQPDDPRDRRKHPGGMAEHLRDVLPKGRNFQ